MMPHHPIVEMNCAEMMRDGVYLKEVAKTTIDGCLD